MAKIGSANIALLRPEFEQSNRLFTEGLTGLMESADPLKTAIDGNLKFLQEERTGQLKNMLQGMVPEDVSDPNAISDYLARATQAADSINAKRYGINTNDVNTTAASAITTALTNTGTQAGNINQQLANKDKEDEQTANLIINQARMMPPEMQESWMIQKMAEYGITTDYMKNLLEHQKTVAGIESGRISDVTGAIGAYTTPQIAQGNFETAATVNTNIGGLIGTSAEAASKIGGGGGPLAKTVASRTSNTATGSGNANLDPNLGVFGISAKYESGGDVSTVGTLASDNGAAYGTVQMIPGTLKGFLNSKEGKKYASYFPNGTGASAANTAAWKKLVQDHPEVAKAQLDYAQRTHYNPAISKAKELGLNTNNPAIQQMIGSGSIQHGGINTIISNVKKSGVNLSDDEAVIKEFYKQREAYASKHAPQYANGFKNRYAKELQDVLAINSGGGTSNSPVANAVNNATGGSAGNTKVLKNPTYSQAGDFIPSQMLAKNPSYTALASRANDLIQSRKKVAKGSAEYNKFTKELNELNSTMKAGLGKDYDNWERSIKQFETKANPIINLDGASADLIKATAAKAQSPKTTTPKTTTTTTSAPAASAPANSAPPRVDPSTVIKYSNKNATRNLKLAPEVSNNVAPYLAKYGLQWDVNSGGQDPKGPTVGGSAHNHGRAGDGLLINSKTGKPLSFNKKEDQQVMAAFIEDLAAAGFTGIGGHVDYMGDGRLHIGIQNKVSVWGGTNGDAHTRNLYPWMKQAFERGRARFEAGGSKMNTSGVQLGGHYVEGITGLNRSLDPAYMKQVIADTYARLARHTGRTQGLLKDVLHFAGLSADEEGNLSYTGRPNTGLPSLSGLTGGALPGLSGGGGEERLRQLANARLADYDDTMGSIEETQTSIQAMAMGARDAINENVQLSEEFINRYNQSLEEYSAELEQMGGLPISAAIGAENVEEFKSWLKNTAGVTNPDEFLEWDPALQAPYVSQFLEMITKRTDTADAAKLASAEWNKTVVPVSKIGPARNSIRNEMISKVAGANKELITKNPSRAKNFETLAVKVTDDVIDFYVANAKTLRYKNLRKEDLSKIVKTVWDEYDNQSLILADNDAKFHRQDVTGKIDYFASPSLYQTILQNVIDRVADESNKAFEELNEKYQSKTGDKGDTVSKKTINSKVGTKVAN